LFFLVIFGVGFNCLWTQDNKIRYSLTRLIDSAIEQNYMLKSSEKQTAIKQANLEILEINEAGNKC